jgi:hypothetical protein
MTKQYERKTELTPQQAAIEDLHRSIHHQNGQIADLNLQVERTQRGMQLDLKEQKFGNLKKTEAILLTVEALAGEVSALVDTLKDQQLQDDHGYYHRRRFLGRQETQKNSRYNRLLAGLKQRIIKEPCPCGKHKTIQFVDPHGAVVDQMCPRAWWIKMSRNAFEQKNLQAFVKATPMTKYLRRFELNS